VTSLIDNDVLLKGACYGLLSDFIPLDREIIGVLGSAKFVVSKRIARLKLSGETASVLSRLHVFLAQSATVEPTSDEIGFAAELESTALRLGLTLDSGESLLCAVMVNRLIPSLLTGDKRAIRTIEVLLRVVPELYFIGGKVRCLEQLVLKCLERGKGPALRAAICAESSIDRALSICFSCTSPTWVEASSFEGVSSYIADLRSDAPTALSL